MKSDHQFKVERVLARHCDALIARGPAPREPKLVVTEFFADLTANLGRAVAPLLGGKLCRLAASDLADGSLSAWRETLPQSSKVLGASGPAGKPEFLIAADLASAISLTDIAFGGTGDLPKALPEEWPSASVSVTEMLGKIVAGSLAKTLNYTAPLATVSDWQDSAKTAFLCGANELFWTSLKPADPNDGSWSINIALPAHHTKIVDGGSSALAANKNQPAPNPARAPFSGIPLNARCELTRLNLPISRAARLKPGDIFPIAIPRDVPIEIAGREIARGAIGALDDRVAIEINQLGPR